MQTIKQLLDVKGTEVWSIEPDKTAFAALEMLSKKNIGALLVIEDQKLVGVFSERDFVRRCVSMEHSPMTSAVRDLMSKSLVVVSPETTLQECMALMTTKRIRHLPVCEGDNVVGIVTIGDIVNQIITEQKFTIQSLEQYIVGG